MAPAGPEIEDVFIASDSFDGPRDGYVYKKGPDGLGYYLDESTEPGATAAVPAPSAADDELEFPERTQPKRDGVPLTEDLIRRKAEHNEGMLSTLEEIALHQLDIDRIEVLNNCRCLQIVYLQCNLISKIENLHRLKKLDYLNIALNNITRIENLERCEELRKLDMTVNFVDLDELHTVGSLSNNTMLRELYLTGNPCAQHWESGYRDYVVATLPQLESLDGVAVTRSERIKALQRLPQLQEELKGLAVSARERKAALRARRAERRRAIAAGEIADDTTDEWCPEVRVADARELREAEEAKEAYQKASRNKGDLFHDQTPRERRLFKADGTPVQMNTAKWPFSMDDDGTSIVVDVALPKFLDSAQVDADVQPTYVRVGAKKHTLQLILPAEVLATASTAQRSSTTGHLLLTCPKVHPIVVSRAPRRKKAAPEALTAAAVAALPAPSEPTAPGSALKGAVDIRSIVSSGAQKEAGGAAKPKESLGEDWSDEEEVPPLL